MKKMISTTKRNLALLLSAILLCTSCRGIELENRTEQVEEYTKEQAMILIANERNRYENVYSSDIWKIRTGDDSACFDRVMVQNVMDFLETVKLLCMIFEEKGLSLSSRDRDSIRKMTDAYMESLSEGDLSYIGCTREDVQKMYTDYYTACKMAKTLSANTDTDISDSEVKVIKIMQIVTSDVKKAKAILKRVKIDGANFNSMASRYTESGQIELTLSKGMTNDLIERTAFALEEGQVSNILCKDGLYYIIRCTDGYDEESTRRRKAGIQTAVDALNFYQVLDPYRREHNIVFFEKFWNEIGFSGESGSTADGFFDYYYMYAD